MENISHELMYAVKEVLVDMAIDATLPSDMTDLDIITVFDLANSKLKSDESYQDKLTINKLFGFVVPEDGDESGHEMLKKWKSLTSANDKDIADNHFTMWESVQYSLTIKQLAEQL